MDKVNVSREEAKAFENLKQVIAKRKGSDETSQLVLGFAEMAAGYEVEQTPQELLKEAYLDHQNLGNANFRYSKGFCEGIEFTLSTLNIKVSGVNT